MLTKLVVRERLWWTTTVDCELYLVADFRSDHRFHEVMGLMTEQTWPRQ